MKVRRTDKGKQAFIYANTKLAPGQEGEVDEKNPSVMIALAAKLLEPVESDEPVELPAAAAPPPVSGISARKQPRS